MERQDFMVEYDDRNTLSVTKKVKGDTYEVELYVFSKEQLENLTSAFDEIYNEAEKDIVKRKFFMTKLSKA